MLELTLLGQPQLRLNGEVLPRFPTAKCDALLYYLIVTGQPNSRETLSDLLWGEMPEAKAKRNLTRALSHLRKVIEPYLLIESQHIAFNRTAPYQLDIEALSKMAADAYSLYRGDFLEGISIKDAEPFTLWQSMQRDRLRDLALERLDQQIEIALTQNELSQGIDIAKSVT